ncbi:Holliday junction branch migration protein RuvA [Arboricoccus pini]|uniref:Holliday junction branch migration protein RuvA n=1 Tax=Arboricoccus pini TaxID=1963835 RepID=UPI002AC89027|nr:Holliday junction branch migration protein RuvA [Arboricoccus pini]
MIDVAGVGYLIHASARTLRQLPSHGEAVEILTTMQVSEEQIRLYGFIDEAEQRTFALLQTVQGVGTRVALGVLGVIGPDGLAAAVMAGDKAALTRAPGVGARLAARILAELKERLVDVASISAPTGTVAAPPGGESGDDALAALVNLGFGRSEAFLALGRVRSKVGGDAAIDLLIRESLKELTH